MNEQLDLDGGEHVLGLTGRQQAALETVERLEGCTLDELGAHMHERRGKHSADYRCDFCPDEGASVANELHRKGFLQREQKGVWRSTRLLGEAAAGRVLGGSAPGASSPSGPVAADAALTGGVGPDVAPGRSTAPYDPKTAEIPF